MNFDRVPQTKQDAFFVRNIVWLVSLIYSSSFIPSVSAVSWGKQVDCTRYCSGECNLYIRGIKFDICNPSEHVHCECPLSATIVIFIIGVGFFVGGILACICVKCYQGGVNKSTVITQPITSNRVETACPVTNNAYFHPPKSTASATTANQMSIPIVSPLTTPQKPSSEEFPLPPPYNEAVRNASYPHY